jgi:hypothetical protein
MRVEAGDNVLIAGFIVEGTATKRLVLRGIGPSLTASGVSDVLQDPTLELFNGNRSLGANDNWAENSNAAEIVATGLAPADPSESALLISLAPGAYTVVIRGKDSGTGVGLVEVYDLDVASPAEVVNISTRGFVRTGENVMIGGFIITGNERSRLVIRAIGPSLGTFGVPNPLGDPFLEVHGSNGEAILENDNWRDEEQPFLPETGLAPSDDRESAIYTLVRPGNYTVIVKDANGGTGNGLVEVYKLLYRE